MADRTCAGVKLQQLRVVDLVPLKDLYTDTSSEGEVNENPQEIVDYHSRRHRVNPVLTLDHTFDVDDTKQDEEGDDTHATEATDQHGVGPADLLTPLV
jgi:hypothetical protein